MKFFTFLFGFIAILCWTSCQNQKPKPDFGSLNVELLRGDIILCSGSSFGKVSFSLSCDNSVRDTFDLAVSLLHSFEYDETEKAFAKVIDEDPDCPMAYWGVAMSLMHHPKFGPGREGFEKGAKVLKIAESLPKTTREQEFLEAVGAYFDNDWKSTTHLMRAKKMEPKMEAIYKKYDDDKEAAIFYALSLFATADSKDKTYAQQKKAGAILESIFPDQPDHPGISHYIIHHYDHPELAQLALPTARRYADIAPGSSHAQHMPSHIFTRLGLWDESIASNLNSAAAAQCYAEDTEMDGHWHNEIHAMDYLVYAYLQKGDNVKANEQYEHLQTINKVYPGKSSPYNFSAIPVRMVLENRQWAKATNLNHHATEHQWDQRPWEIALLHFARSLGASHTGDVDSAEKELAILQSLHQKLVDKEDTYRSDQVLIQVKASEAWILFAKGNQNEALALMEEAVDLEEKTGKHPITPGEVLPAPELLGDMLLALNRPVEALEAYEMDLRGHPNRFNGIYGAAVAANKAGNREKAKMYFESLIKLTEQVESDRPEIEEANRYLSQI